MTQIMPWFDSGDRGAKCVCPAAGRAARACWRRGGYLCCVRCGISGAGGCWCASSDQHISRVSGCHAVGWGRLFVGLWVIAISRRMAWGRISDTIADQARFIGARGGNLSGADMVKSACLSGHCCFVGRAVDAICTVSLEFWGRGYSGVFRFFLGTWIWGKVIGACAVKPAGLAGA